MSEANFKIVNGVCNCPECNKKENPNQYKIDDLLEELTSAYQRLNTSNGDNTSIEASDTIESVEGELKALGVSDDEITDYIQNN